MRFLIERIRYVRAWLAWQRSIRQRAVGLEALFTFDGLPEQPLSRPSIGHTDFACALILCTECGRVPRPAQVAVATTEADLNYVCWWLVEHLPEIWYREHPIRTKKMAEVLVKLREGVEAGRWHIESVAS